MICKLRSTSPNLYLYFYWGCGGIPGASDAPFHCTFTAESADESISENRSTFVEHIVTIVSVFSSHDACSMTF